MEDGDTLHLARGAARQWLSAGKILGVQDMPTQSGTISYELQYNEEAGNVSGFVELSRNDKAHIVLHIRAPGGRRIGSVSTSSGGSMNSDKSTISWKNLTGKVYFDAKVM
jgi:hypothetical protein